MNLEVFEGAESAREAVDLSKRARQQRFDLYKDLRSPRGMRALLADLSETEGTALANQITQASQSKGGFPEYLARRVEEAVGLPYGYLDQPYPYPELRASLVRARRLKRFADSIGDEAELAVGKRRFEQLTQACVGLRGVSEAFYLKVMKVLRKVSKDRK